jgi:hypothetical protein
MKVVVSVLNFVRSRGIVSILSFLSEAHAEYGDVLYHAEIRWLSRGIALKLVTEMFMNEKGEDVAKLGDENLLRDGKLLCDIG